MSSEDLAYELCLWYLCSVFEAWKFHFPFIAITWKCIFQNVSLFCQKESQWWQYCPVCEVFQYRTSHFKRASWLYSPSHFWILEALFLYSLESLSQSSLKGSCNVTFQLCQATSRNKGHHRIKGPFMPPRHHEVDRLASHLSRASFDIKTLAFWILPEWPFTTWSENMTVMWDVQYPVNL